LANLAANCSTPSAHASGYLIHFTGQTLAEPSRLPEMSNDPSALNATL
jgi:hypothetical protein